MIDPPDITYGMVVDGPTIETDAFDTYLQELQQRIDYEVRAAWRLDYDYAHLYEKVNTIKCEIETMVAKSNHHWYENESPTPPDGYQYKHTYVLKPDSEIIERKKQLRQ